VDAGSRSPDGLQPYTSTAGASSLAARVTNLETRESERDRLTARDSEGERDRAVRTAVRLELAWVPGPLNLTNITSLNLASSQLLDSIKYSIKLNKV
jgi:hypothetical protein